jgi:dienelactone hydrolase
MLHDDLLALHLLLAHPQVDSARIGTTGMSMGGSRATWLAALDERIKVTIPVAQMTRYRDYAAQGDFALHGIYYYLPGILQTALDMEHLTSLTAPRPQVILIGDQDPLSPIGGVRTIDAFTRAIYGLYHAEDRYQMTIYAGVAHQYTPTMYAAMLAGFQTYL